MRRLAAVLLAGCVELGPDVGALQQVPCDNADSAPAVPTSFETDIRPIFLGAGHCVACHTAGGRSPFGLEISGLDLANVETLLAGGAQSGASIVIRGRPCDSVLIQKLGPSPPFGARMPLDGPPYLDAQAIRTIADWIAEGAP